MTLPRSAADVLAEHVSWEVECIDRMYLNVYVPKLMFAAGIDYFFRGHRGHLFTSSALMDPMTKAFTASIHRFVDDQGVDLVHFAKDQRKDDVAKGYLAMTARTGSCSSAGPRRRPRCSAPRSGATR